MKKYIKPKTVVIKIDVLPLLAGSGNSDNGGGGGGGEGYAKRYNTALVDASPVGRSLNENSNDDDTKWY